MSGFIVLVVAADGTRLEYPAKDADDADQVRFAARCLHPDAAVSVVAASDARPLAGRRR